VNKPKNAVSERRLTMIAAAFLRGKGKKQEEIASLLHITQPEVSRLLDEAVNAELLNPHPSFLSESVKPHEMEEVERRYFAAPEIAERLRTYVPAGVSLNVRVFSGTEDQFLDAAAVRVLDLLRGSRCCGLMWGRTLSELVRSIRKQCAMRSSRQGMDIESIPLCGDPIHLMNQREVEFSASQLSSLLERTLARKPREDLPCLTGVPAYVSAKIRKQPAFEEFLDSIPGYRQIFVARPGGQSPLIESVDTIISGIGVMVTAPGSKGHETAAFIRERLLQENIAQNALDKLIYGDIGGILIERRSLTVSEKKVVANLNEGWIGLRAKTLKRIARQAGEHQHPGMIVVAFGARKAEVVLEALSQGYVNELIIDSTLAETLRHLSEKRRLRP
jgi:DNA-binding transcriptional regulator LsrR (DeoR family)